MCKEINEPFDTKYNTWIIAYCPDTDSFFITDERHFFWENEKKFNTEDEGIEYFKEHLDKFKQIRQEIRKNIGGIPKHEKVFLENILTWL